MDHNSSPDHQVSRARRHYDIYNSSAAAPGNSATHTTEELSTRASYELSTVTVQPNQYITPEETPATPTPAIAGHSQEQLLSSREQDAIRESYHENVLRGSAEQQPIASTQESHCQLRTVLNEIWLPLAWILCPMLIVLGVLLVLILMYRVRPKRGLFLEPTGWDYSQRHRWIMLNIPATWLTFVVTRASQFAALLAGPLMELWTWRVAHAMIMNSTTPDGDIPTSYQLSLLIGICLASPGRLRRLTSYRSCRSQRLKSPRSPRLLAQAGRMFSLCILLALVTLGADTLIHYTTETVENHVVTISKQLEEHGRGLSQDCIMFNRSENGRMPCTVNMLIPDRNYTGQQNEMFLLAQNASDRSEVRVVPTYMGLLATLFPKTEHLSPYVDFHTSTVGFSTHCRPITQLCDFEPMDADGVTRFNCSSKLYGVTGKSNADTLDTDYPPLAFRINKNIILAFFADSNLSVPYNSIGYNPDTGAIDQNHTLLPDDQLLNEIHVAFAAEFSAADMSADADVSMDRGYYNTSEAVLNVVLSCSYKAMHVRYTWFNGSHHDIQYQDAPNGTLSELWHGSYRPSSLSGDSPTLQTMLKKAAMSYSSLDFAEAWAKMYSTSIMSTVGGVLSPRSNESQQDRLPILVILVWIPALVLLALCCASFIVLASILGICAVSTASTGGIVDAKNRISVFGLVAHATNLQLRNQTRQDGPLSKESKITVEREVWGLMPGTHNDYHFEIRDLSDVARHDISHDRQSGDRQ